MNFGSRFSVVARMVGAMQDDVTAGRGDGEGRAGVVADLVRLAGYGLAVGLLAVWLAPLVFQAGKALAEVSLGRPTNPPLEWLARRADAMEFSGFFVVTVAVMAVGLLPWLMRAMRMRLVPERALFLGGGQSVALRAGAVGFVAVFGVGLAVAAMVGEWAWRPGLLGWVLVKAIVVAGVYEWMFRGVWLGLWLRVCRPAVAVGASALAFALVRVMLPPPDFAYEDAESWSLGWRMLWMLAGSPGFWLDGVLPAMGWGGLLALARMRWKSLWPPVFLHAGWMAAAGVCAGGSGWVTWGMLCAGCAVLGFVRKKRGPDARD